MIQTTVLHLLGMLGFGWVLYATAIFYDGMRREWNLEKDAQESIRLQKMRDKQQEKINEYHREKEKIVQEQTAI